MPFYLASPVFLEKRVVAHVHKGNYRRHDIMSGSDDVLFKWSNGVVRSHWQRKVSRDAQIRANAFRLISLSPLRAGNFDHKAIAWRHFQSGLRERRGGKSNVKS